MILAYLGLGANLGDPAANIRRALALLEEHPAIRVRRMAGLYETEPVGYADQPWFVNTAAEIETDLPPEKLLSACLDVEKQLGRVRGSDTEKNGPRPIDIDILLYGDACYDKGDPIIPHPRMHERLFVLAPLAELIPDKRHPILNRRIDDLKTDASSPDQANAANAGGGTVLRMMTAAGA